jgi:hypothetical protein
VADLLGVASIIGASATFVGTTGSLWLAATGRSNRHRDDEDDEMRDYSADQLEEELERRRREKSQRKGNHRRVAEFVDHLLGRESVMET